MSFRKCVSLWRSCVSFEVSFGGDFFEEYFCEGGAYGFQCLGCLAVTVGIKSRQSVVNPAVGFFRVYFGTDLIFFFFGCVGSSLLCVGVL